MSARTIVCGIRKSTLRRRRLDAERWYPRSYELKLPDVPESLRPKARKVLSPILQAMNEYLREKGRGVKGGQCWETAFLVSLLSNNVGGPLLDYCEGVWTRSHENKWWAPDDGTDPAPHAWNLFEGHIVDLTAEFYAWNSNGEDAPWLHEPLKAYSPEEIFLHARNSNWDCATSDIWLANGGRETLPEEIKRNLIKATEYDSVPDAEGQHAFEFVNEIVFKEARERLLARINSTTQAAAA